MSRGELLAVLENIKKSCVVLLTYGPTMSAHDMRQIVGSIVDQLIGVMAKL
jgi:hypothetical protein